MKTEGKALCIKKYNIIEEVTFIKWELYPYSTEKNRIMDAYDQPYNMDLNIRDPKKHMVISNERFDFPISKKTFNKYFRPFI